MDALQRTGTPDLDVARLVDFACAHDLEFVVLFGSRARGCGRPDSDFDLALMPEGWDSPMGQLEVAMALSQTLGRGDVDTTWLPRASWLLWARVARDGQLLYEKRRGAFRSFQSAAVLEASDSDHWRRWQLKGIRRSISKDRRVDTELIRQRLALLTEVLHQMRSLVEVPREQYVAEVMRYWAVERSFLLLVEYAAAINAEAASAAGIPPSDYYSSFFSASRAGWLEHSLAEQLASLVSLRNQLVHAYQNVDVGSVYDRVCGSIAAWERYVEAVLDRLTKGESAP